MVTLNVYNVLVLYNGYKGKIQKYKLKKMSPETEAV